MNHRSQVLLIYGIGGIPFKRCEKTSANHGPNAICPLCEMERRSAKYENWRYRPKDGPLPGSWLMGQFVELHHVADGLARVASVKTKNSI